MDTSPLEVVAKGIRPRCWEGIDILRNLHEIGQPVPDFMTKAIAREIAPFRNMHSLKMPVDPQQLLDAILRGAKEPWEKRYNFDGPPIGGTTLQG